MANKLDIEHEYVDAVLSMPGAKGHVLLRDVRVTGEGMDKVRFMEFRSEILRGMFSFLSSNRLDLAFAGQSRFWGLTDSIQLYVGT